MTASQTVLLGAIAGSTIYLGLPMGRLRTSSVRLKIFLSGISAGILVFLLVEIFEHAFSSVEEALQHAQKGAPWGRVAGLGSLYAVGILAGMMGLYYVLKRRQSRPRQSIGPGAMATAELAPKHLQRRQALEL